MPPTQMPSAIQRTPETPQTTTADQQMQKAGLTKEEQARIVGEIITPYRTQWATERIIRMARWQKNTEFDKGNQALTWDKTLGCWFNTIDYLGQRDPETDYSYLSRYLNNITQTVRRNFVAAMSRGIPPVVVQPENAENLADSTTAKAAQEAVGIIERENRVKTMVREEAQILFLCGVYFKWTRFKIDGAWMGYKNEPTYGEIPVATGDHLHCTTCGKDTNAPPSGQVLPSCPYCGSQFGPLDYYQGESDTMPGITGYQQKPNGMVKWTVYSPMMVDTDPTAQSIAHCPLLALDMETDVAEIRAIYPKMFEEISEGTESATDPNASYNRLVRTLLYSSAYSTTSDIFMQRVTFTQVWIQPTSYYRVSDKAFIAKMQQLFPYGCKVSMCGALVLDVKPAVLEKEWTACLLHEGYGMYPPSIADNVVPFNERFNNVSNILDDYMERCATGITLADPRRIDVTQISGKALSGAVLNPTPTVGEGVSQPLSNSLYHFEFKMDPDLPNYLDRLWNYCQIISGVPPQVSGVGTTEGVETAKGQKQMLDQALGTLGVIWDNVKDEHAAAGRNAIECLQANMAYTGDLWSVVRENGSEFRNNYVHLDEMQGRIRVYAQTDEGLPMSPEQKRDFWNQTMQLANSEPTGPAAKLLDIPTNQQLAFSSIGLAEAVAPGAASRSKTLQVIAKLLESKPMPMVGANGQVVLDDDGTPMYKPSIAPDKWIENYPMLEATVLEFTDENPDVKMSNPQGWLNIIAYYRMALNFSAQVDASKAKLTLSVKQAGLPAPPQPDPVILKAQQDLLTRSVRSVDRLAEFGEMDPLGQNGSIAGQVTAEGKILDTALKAATAMMPDK